MVMLSILLLGSQKLITTKYYKELLTKSNSYELVLKAIPKNTDTSGEGGDIILAITEKITPVYLEKTVASNLDQFDAFLNNRAKSFDPSIDISSFKDEITSQFPTEVREMVPNILSFSSYTEFWNNIGQLTSSTLKSSPGVGQNDVANINQQIDSVKNAQQQFNKNVNSVKKGYFYSKIIVYVFFALTLLTLLMIILAARHSIPAIFRWTGQTLFWSGLLSLIMAFLAQYIVKNYNFLSSMNLTKEVTQLVTPLYKNVITDISSSLIKISFLVAVIGLIFVIVSYILPMYIPEKAKSFPMPTKAWLGMIQ